MAHALSVANAYAPRGEASHLARWEAREPISSAFRERFLVAVAAEERRARAKHGFSLADEFRPARERNVDRVSIRRALVAHGLLW